MPVTQETETHVVCDNPDCPGNTLDPASLTGWTLVTHEVYGDLSEQHVFCSNACVSAVSSAATPGKAWL